MNLVGVRMSNTRIYKKNMEIDELSVIDFFKNRAGSDCDSIVKMCYQDQNPSLSFKRDKYEKLALSSVLDDLDLKTKKVLDYGCGVGRHSEFFNSMGFDYTGIDPIKSFIEQAKRSLSKQNAGTIRFFWANDPIKKLADLNLEEYTLITILGVLHYINDIKFERLMREIAVLCSSEVRLIIRCPVANKTRLTLMKHWSEDLNFNYSAIYRTLDEMKQIFSKSGFLINSLSKVYPDLENNTETTQMIFVLERNF